MGSLANPNKEPRSAMESPDIYPVTYAISAVRDPNNSVPLAIWDKTAEIYQLYPLDKPSDRNRWSDSKAITLSNQTIFGTVRAVSQEYSARYGELPGKSFDSVQFEATRPGESKTKLDVLFAVVPRDSAIDSSVDKGSTSNDRGPTRAFFRPDKDITVKSRRDGIIIETFESGSDLVIPNGPGGVLFNTQKRFDPPRYPKVDRTSTFVNSGSGKDVIIGGYGADHFGGTRADTLWSSRKPRTKDLFSLLRPALDAQGSKLMIGGSSDDVLIGGADQDYLVGDRLISNNQSNVAAELFLPTNPAKPTSEQVDLSYLPSFLSKHIEAISSYQPAYFYKQSNSYSQFSNEVALNRSSNAVSIAPGKDFPTLYQLWIPGNDVIRGGKDDDIIFGDDNTNYGAGASLTPLITMKRFADSINSKDGVGYLSDDERNAGVTWTDLFLSNAKDPALGADFLHGGGGNDMIYGGFGEDAIIGGRGSDLIDFGAQIVAKGYRPFWGPKVAFGDGAKFNGREWIAADEEDKDPDHFIAPDLFTDKDDLSSGGSAMAEEIQSARDTYLDRLTTFTDYWDGASRIIGYIPVAGDLINKIVSDITYLVGLLAPDPPDYSKIDTSGPADIDSMTVIRDFDSFDMITIRTEKGNRLAKDENKIRIGASNNPLFDNPNGSYVKEGTSISISQNQKLYPRIFLEGYTDELAIIGFENRDAVVNGVKKTFTYWTLGGKDFLGKDTPLEGIFEQF